MFTLHFTTVRVLWPDDAFFIDVVNQNGNSVSSLNKGAIEPTAKTMERVDLLYASSFKFSFLVAKSVNTYKDCGS